MSVSVTNTDPSDEWSLDFETVDQAKRHFDERTGMALNWRRTLCEKLGLEYHFERWEAEHNGQRWAINAINYL